MAIVTLLVLLWALVSPVAAQHAIEGFGAGARGGTGQPECTVSSLANSGTGTLRDCLVAGNRTIKFAVAGTIQLSSVLRFHSFVTVDGFSAPAPGITLRGFGLSIQDVQHVIVRALRIRDAGLSDKSDCISIYGQSQHIVIDHVSIANCGDGAVDISSGPKDITLQWSLFSTRIPHLWGSTADSPRTDTDRISMHHSLVICGGLPICDRFPLIRANGYPLRVDLRDNVFQGWTRTNGTKIEPAAQVNVVGNAYIPRPESTFEQRGASLQVNEGTRVYASGNVELGEPPRPNLNDSGNERTLLAAPAVTRAELGCVVQAAGVTPRDAEDQRLLTFVSAVPAGCSAR
jgi:pectate lyase